MPSVIFAVPECGNIWLLLSSKKGRILRLIVEIWDLQNLPLAEKWAGISTYFTDWDSSTPSRPREMTEILIVMEINYTFFKSGGIWIPFAPSCLQNLEIQMPENNLSSVSYGDLIKSQCFCLDSITPCVARLQSRDKNRRWQKRTVDESPTALRANWLIYNDTLLISTCFCRRNLF